MVDKKLNEGFTEFANPQNPWFHPFGVVGRFFSRFLSRQARGENDSNPPDQIEDPVTHKKVQASQPLDGDTVASDKVIIASTMLHSKGAHPILPEMEYDRRRRYREYEDMDGYPEISSAFDIYADDCSQENLDGTKWDIISEDEMARDEVSRLFDTINLDQYLWDIVRNTVKYGDNFIELVVDTKNIKKGIQRIKILNPNYIYRVENEFGYLKSFFQQIPAKDEWTSYGGAGPDIENSQIIPLDPGQIVHFKLYTSDPTHYPYGKSVAQSARQIYKSLKMMEDAMLIYRLCLVGDTRVSTNEGYKYIKDINKGDLVYCFAGPSKGLELTKVTNSWETGTKPVYEVRSQHFKVTGTETHPILVLNRDTMEVSYVPIKELEPKTHSFVYEKSINNNVVKALYSTRDLACKITNTDVFVNLSLNKKEDEITKLSQSIGLNRNSIRNFLYGQQFLKQEQAFKVLEHFGILKECQLESKFEGFCSNQNFRIPAYVDSEFARLFGFMLGDGSISDNALTFAEGEHEGINNYYSSLLEKYFGKCVRYTTSGRKYGNYTSNSTLGAELFKSLGFSNGAHSKRFPEWAFKVSDDIKLNLVLGFADADGTKRSLSNNYWTTEIEICNKELLEDIKELWTSIGLCSGHIRKRVRKGHILEGRELPETTSYSLYLSSKDLDHFEPIQSITHIGEEKVYDIEVEHEKHNFIANGVVVHNSRAPERRIFYLDTGALPSSKAQAHIQEQMNRFKKSKVFDNKTGNINATYNAIAADEDFYIAVNGKGSGTKIETLPGAENLGEVDDVKYFRDKLLASLKIPKDYIVEKDQSPERKANLSQLDVKFARVINRIQKSVETGLQLIAKRHLLIKGYPKHIVNRLKVKLPAPSDMARKRQLDLDEQKARVVSAVKGLGLFPTKKIYKDYYQLNDYQIEEIKAELKKEMNDPVFGQQQMPGMGGPGMPMDDPMSGGMPPEGGIPQQEPNENVPPTQNEAIEAYWSFLSEPAKQVLLELKSSVNKNKV
jgi:intein/homing endonuclease